MKRVEPFRDVEREMERFMVNLYKKSIRKGGLDPKNLKGNWSEASSILQAHFGRVTRMAEQKKHKLVNLYRTAVDEMRLDRT